MLADISALAAVLGFTEQDLAANRAGILSSGQALLLGNAHASVERIASRNLRGLPVIIVAGFALALTLLLTESDVDTSQVIVGMVGAMGAALFVFVVATGRGRKRWDMTSGSVNQAEGQVRTRTRHLTSDEGGGYVHEVTIGAATFRVAGTQVLTAFHEGQPYVGYYVGQGATAMLLSAEPV